MEPTDQEIALKMRTRGGGFVRCIGEAFLHADSVNTAKLKSAFPEYWEEYKTVVKLDKERGPFRY